MSERYLRELASQERRARRLPADARCAVCGIDAQLSLVGAEVRC